VLLRYEIFARYAFFGKLLQFDLRFLRQTYESWHIELHKTKFHRKVFTGFIGTETRTHRRVCIMRTFRTLLQQQTTAPLWTCKEHSLFRCATDCKQIRKLKAVLIQKPLLPSERSASACCITTAIRRRWLARMSIHVCGLLHKFPWPLSVEQKPHTSDCCGCLQFRIFPLEGFDVNHVDRTLGLNNTEFFSKSTYFIHVWIIFRIKAVRCFYSVSLIPFWRSTPWIHDWISMPYIPSTELMLRRLQRVTEKSVYYLRGCC